MASYNVAQGEAVLQAKLNKAIEAGRSSAVGVIQRIQNEMPVDRVVKTDGLVFSQENGNLVVEASEMTKVGNGVEGRRSTRLGSVHRNALSQLATRADLPMAYATTLLDRGDWGRDLLAENLNTIFGKTAPQRVLSRAVNGQVRGVLSDSYRRLDARPIIEAFASSCQKVGAIPVEGVGGDLRLSIRALLPMVFKSASEVFAFGISIGTSDFGAGALSVEGFLMRLACLNGMTMQEELRKIHIGGRIDQDMQLSQKTYNLDAKAMASAVTDIVQKVLAPERVNGTLDLIGKAATEKIDPATSFRALAKKGLLKRELEAAEDVYRSGGVEQLPPGDTTYRMANALSWIAKTAETPERRMELEAMAGEIVLKAA